MTSGACLHPCLRPGLSLLISESCPRQASQEASRDAPVSGSHLLEELGLQT